MTLDEQINLMEELLSDDDHWSCENAKTDYRQLQEWLKDYKRLLEMPKGDLISRYALKKAICIDEPISIDETWEQLYDAVVKAIDNAPTVEPEITEKQAILFLINNGWIVNHDKELREKWERPQGEWIDRMVDTGYVECPFCHKQITGGDLNFCVKCGADMRTKENLNG